MSIREQLFSVGWAEAPKDELFSIVLKLSEYIPAQGVRISGSASVAKSAVISGDVTIDAGVRIFEHAVIKGPCHISEGAIIGNSSLVRGASFIGRNAIIGNHCYVTNCFIGDYGRVTHFCGISRSVVGRNSCLSTFVNTPTLRADRSEVSVTSQGKEFKYKKIGAIFGRDAYVAPHVVIMPGVQIGEGSFVGSFLVINNDIASHSMVYAEQTIKTKPFEKDFPEVPPGSGMQ